MDEIYALKRFKLMSINDGGGVFRRIGIHRRCVPFYNFLSFNLEFFDKEMKFLSVDRAKREFRGSILGNCFSVLFFGIYFINIINIPSILCI
jgi:hypothetical protein